MYSVNPTECSFAKPQVLFHRYDELMKERLARRRERLKQGLPVDDDEEDNEIFAEFEADEDGKVDAKAILEDMQKR